MLEINKKYNKGIVLWLLDKLYKTIIITFWAKILCSLSWPQSHNVAKNDLELLTFFLPHFSYDWIMVLGNNLVLRGAGGQS